ncbi:hypothetical protein [Natrinema versiforme]|uniref:Uncharacterized protein n=1 Tax=Natrinema versiforme TaxID=88724 RepID=A0A4V1FYE6_9EURY|nr:hypothetical protein [Natrinema versiforme]QCS41297.1 hypothetical protein FEJ81_02635 [Natrinema versiforme]
MVDEERDYETDTLNPTEDIDVSHNVDTLRMERMDSETIYLAGYTDDDDEPDYRYWIISTEEGLRIDSELHSGGL